jgi:hypothetical protein
MTAATVKVFIADLPAIPVPKPTLQPDHGKQGIGMVEHDSQFRGRASAIVDGPSRQIDRDRAGTG